jgi:hypothetical protein
MNQTRSLVARAVRLCLLFDIPLHYAEDIAQDALEQAVSRKVDRIFAYANASLKNCAAQVKRRLASQTRTDSNWGNDPDGLPDNHAKLREAGDKGRATQQLSRAPQRARSRAEKTRPCLKCGKAFYCKDRRRKFCGWTCSIAGRSTRAVKAKALPSQTLDVLNDLRDRPAG